MNKLNKQKKIMNSDTVKNTKDLQKRVVTILIGIFLMSVYTASVFATSIGIQPINPPITIQPIDTPIKIQPIDTPIRIQPISPPIDNMPIRPILDIQNVWSDRTDYVAGDSVKVYAQVRYKDGLAHEGSGLFVQATVYKPDPNVCNNDNICTKIANIPLNPEVHFDDSLQAFVIKFEAVKGGDYKVHWMAKEPVTGGSVDKSISVYVTKPTPSLPVLEITNMWTEQAQYAEGDWVKVYAQINYKNRPGESFSGLKNHVTVYVPQPICRYPEPCIAHASINPEVVYDDFAQAFVTKFQTYGQGQYTISWSTTEPVTGSTAYKKMDVDIAGKTITPIEISSVWTEQQTYQEGDAVTIFAKVVKNGESVGINNGIQVTMTTESNCQKIYAKNTGPSSSVEAPNCLSNIGLNVQYDEQSGLFMGYMTANRDQSNVRIVALNNEGMVVAKKSIHVPIVLVDSVPKTMQISSAGAVQIIPFRQDDNNLYVDFYAKVVNPTTGMAFTDSDGTSVVIKWYAQKYGQWKWENGKEIVPQQERRDLGKSNMIYQSGRGLWTLSAIIPLAHDGSELRAEVYANNGDLKAQYEFGFGSGTIKIDPINYEAEPAITDWITEGETKNYGAQVKQYQIQFLSLNEKTAYFLINNKKYSGNLAQESKSNTYEQKIYLDDGSFIKVYDITLQLPVARAYFGLYPAVQTFVSEKLVGPMATPLPERPPQVETQYPIPTTHETSIGAAAQEGTAQPMPSTSAQQGYAASRTESTTQSGTDAKQWNDGQIRTQEPCQGCTKEGSCLGIGIRMLGTNNQGLYCDTDKMVKPQKITGTNCQNSFECSSNNCGSGKCQDTEQRLDNLERNMQETQGLLQRITAWLENFFK